MLKLKIIKIFIFIFRPITPNIKKEFIQEVAYKGGNCES